MKVLQNEFSEFPHFISTENYMLLPCLNIKSITGCPRRSRIYEAIRYARDPQIANGIIERSIR